MHEFIVGCGEMKYRLQSMSDGGSEDTNGRSAPGIKFGFISQFSNEWSMIVKYKKE